MKRYSYRERDYTFGQAMLTLRTSIGLTQAGLADLLGVSRRAVGEWEQGSSYPKTPHLQHFIVLCVQQHVFPPGREAEEIRAFWKAAHQKVLLDEAWLSALLTQPSAPPVPVEEAGGAAVVRAPMRKYVGEQLGNYRLLRLLGEGGQASVYLGEHVYLGSQAALKVRHAVLTNEEQTVFLQEAQTLVRLTHPHIVRVLDFAVEDGMPFLVMEYAPQGTLRQRHPRGTQLPLDVILPYVQQVASALQYTHDQHLIHRDVKPENMLLGSQGEVLLSDFGLVMLVPQTLPSEATELMEKSMAGTSPYLAPEQLRGKAHPSSDQYALGVVVYEWLCGKPPFHGSFLEVAVQHISVPPPSLCEQVPGLSPALEEVVLRALAKEHELRFASVQDFATALEHGSQEIVSPCLTPVIAPKNGVETGQRSSSMRQLPTGTVTLLFTGMEGSTRLLQQLGDRYASVLTECRQLLRAASQHWSGHEVETQGDAFFVVFARATDAVSAAVAMQRALAAHVWPNGMTVRVRIGVHTGEPQRSSEGYVGLDVHHTARIMSAGHGGQVLLSQTTRDLVELTLPAGVSLLDLGEHRLKDLQRSSHLFQLVISGLAVDFPALKTLDTQPNNLPIQPTAFIGREQELAAVATLLCREDVQLVTLTGPGGTGKTRLCLQVAAELSEVLPDGVFFVNLAPLSDPEFVLPAIAQVLNVKEIGGQSLLDLLKTFLREKHMLLLLDTFEQVVNAALPVAELLTACPKLKIMVTSRAALHVRAEHECAVPPLELPDPKRLPDLDALSQYEAVALFIQRAQAVKSDFQMTNANAPAVAGICVRLDGMPLAIELAATRAKFFAPQALLSRLEQGLALLSGGARDLPARQQTLRGAIAWSYDLLPPQEQQLFRRLAVFVNGCTIEAAEVICRAAGELEADLLDGLLSLVDKSLLRQEESTEGEPRFQMLQTVREYGLETLAASGEVEATRLAHAHFFLALAEQAKLELGGPNQAAWIERLEQEHDNLSAALEWALEGMTDEQASVRREVALRLSAALGAFWRIHGHYREGRTFLERALAQSEGASAFLRAKVLGATADVAYWQGDLDRAEVLAQQCLALDRELGDTRGIANCFFLLGFVAWTRGKTVEAITLSEERIRLMRQIGQPGEVADALFQLAWLVSHHGEDTRGQVLFEEALVLFRKAGNELRVGATLVESAFFLWLAQGEEQTIRQRLQQGQALINKVGDKHWSALSSLLSVLVALSEGEAAKALILAKECLAIFREVDSRWYIALTFVFLGWVQTRQGELTAACSSYQESLALCRKLGEKWIIPFNLEGLAGVSATRGEFRRAAQLWGAAEALREGIASPLPPTFRADYEQAVAATRAELGEEAFAAAWQEGRTMPLEQASA